MVNHIKRKNNQKGAILLVTALLLFLFLGCCAFVVDLGIYWFSTSAIQNAADAAALAGANEYAVVLKKKYGSDNVPFNKVWDKEAKEKADEIADEYIKKNIASLRGSYSTYKRRSEGANEKLYYRVVIKDEVPLFFMQIFGLKTEESYASAIAIVPYKEYKNSDHYGGGGGPGTGEDVVSRNMISVDSGFSGTVGNNSIRPDDFIQGGTMDGGNVYISDDNAYNDAMNTTSHKYSFTQFSEDFSNDFQIRAKYIIGGGDQDHITRKFQPGEIYSAETMAQYITEYALSQPQQNTNASDQNYIRNHGPVTKDSPPWELISSIWNNGGSSESNNALTLCMQAMDKKGYNHKDYMKFSTLTEVMQAYIDDFYEHHPNIPPSDKGVMLYQQPQKADSSLIHAKDDKIRGAMDSLYNGKSVTTYQPRQNEQINLDIGNAQQYYVIDELNEHINNDPNLPERPVNLNQKLVININNTSSSSDGGHPNEPVYLYVKGGFSSYEINLNSDSSRQIFIYIPNQSKTVHENWKSWWPVDVSVDYTYSNSELIFNSNNHDFRGTFYAPYTNATNIRVEGDLTFQGSMTFNRADVSGNHGHFIWEGLTLPTGGDNPGGGGSSSSRTTEDRLKLVTNSTPVNGWKDSDTFEFLMKI